MSTVRTLAAVVVNYDSGALANSCVASLIDGWRLAGRARDDLRVVVVDNASPIDQSNWLGQLRAHGVEIVLAPENLGYARGVNLGASRVRVWDPDALAILNPDLLFLPGSVGALLDGLARHPGAGAVAPRTSFDPDGALQLPPGEVPTPLTHWRDTIAQLDPALGRAAAASRARRATRVWTRDEDVALETLSGACLVLPRAALEALRAHPAHPAHPAGGGRATGPMDDRYPLYFEDTDLCWRLAKLGFGLVRIGDARVCHLWARSSGAGPEFSDDARSRFLVSRDRWFRRTHGGVGLAFAAAADRVLDGWPADLRHRPIHAFGDLGALATPPTLELARPGPFVMEVGLEPTLGLAGGALGEGARWSFPTAAWEWLFRGPVYCRALDPRDGALRGAWSFVKTTEPRTVFDHLASGARAA